MSLSPWTKLSTKLSSQANARLSTGYGLRGRTLGLVCVCRNSSIGSLPDIPQLAAKFKKSFHTVSWNPFPVDIWEDMDLKKATKSRQPSPSITVCVNMSVLATEYISNVLKSAKAKLDAGAYLHWYERHDISANDIKNSFKTVENIVKEYRDAIK